LKNTLLKIGLFVTIFVIFGVFIYINLNEIQKTLNVTTSSLTVWIILALIFGLFSYFFVIKSDQKSFEMVNVLIPFKRMFRLNLSSLATNTLIPSAGVSGGLVFVEDSKDHDYTPSAAVAGHILYILSDFSSITILLVTSLLYLFFTRTLMASTTIPVVLFLTITLGFYFLLYLSAKDSQVAKKIIAWLLVPVFWLVNFFSKKKSDSHESVNSFFTELCFASSVIKKEPQKLLTAIGWAIGNHLVKLLCLYLLFYSFGYHIKPSVLLAGYIIGIVVLIVSPTPNGIGFVEGSMVIVFTALGVPREIAATATLIYRGFAFWIPFFVGLFLLQSNRIKKIRQEMGELNEKKQIES
jgi:glycosyltransferase 2 family protein